MKILIPILAALLCTALCLLPFEQPKKGYVKSTKPTSLAGVALSILKAISPDDIKKSAAAIAGFIALCAVWAPIIIILEARAFTLPLNAGGQALFIVQGILIILAGAATFLVMGMNSMVFGFGASKATEPTPLFATILTLEAMSAIASVTLGLSPAAMAWLHRVLVG